MTTDIEEIAAAQKAKETFDQKRRAERFDYSMTLFAQLLELDFSPIGTAFQVSARNLSTGGMAVLHSSAVETGSLIGLQLTRDSGQIIKIVMRVIRCTSSEQGYEIAGRFVTRL